FYALIMLSARWIGRVEGIWPLMFYVVAFPLVFSGLVVWTVWRAPEPEHLPLFLGMAVFGTLGLTLISQAFRMGAAAVVAPFDYTALIWASILGWLVWGEIPGLWTYGGAAVIIASGIYIVLRETRRPRA
ncbi:MAG TPA: DMT family transporter, partial [Thermohalobaculum sp.]|nr:DMT family transporter [Thermohalobaculum sp.]